MGLEIERKFRVVSDAWRTDAASAHIEQGYLAVGPPVGIRVRIQGDTATLNIKTATVSISRTEFEYEIPLDDARELLRGSCLGSVIEKTRFVLPYEGMRWEVDEFAGANEGLVVAEIELESEDQAFARPPWIGVEVSRDRRYHNTSLCLHPYSTWDAASR